MVGFMKEWGHTDDGSGLTSEKNDVYDDTMKICVEADIFVCRREYLD